MPSTTAKFRIVGISNFSALLNDGAATPAIKKVDLHFINQVTWDPQTSEINFEGDDQQVRRTYLNGINVAIRSDTYDLAAVSDIFKKSEVTTVVGVAGRIYFGDSDEVAGAACGVNAEARAENLTTGLNETLMIVSPKGRMQVVKPPTFGYNAKAPLELTYAAEKTSTDILGVALTGVPAGGAMWFVDRIVAAP